jgi:AraC-like DNA-binding protein
MLLDRSAFLRFRLCPQVSKRSRQRPRRLAKNKYFVRRLSDELRLHVPLRYLRETNMTTEDISFAVGFSDAANFRHAFRRWTGKTPHEFRRKTAGAARTPPGWPNRTLHVAALNLDARTHESERAFVTKAAGRCARSGRARSGRRAHEARGCADNPPPQEQNTKRGGHR